MAMSSYTLKPLSVRGQVAEMTFRIPENLEVRPLPAKYMIRTLIVEPFEAACLSKGYEPYGEPVIESQRDLFSMDEHVRVSAFVRKK